jgi:hypothetical protein
VDPRRVHEVIEDAYVSRKRNAHHGVCASLSAAGI